MGIQVTPFVRLSNSDVRYSATVKDGADKVFIALTEKENNYAATVYRVDNTVLVPIHRLPGDKHGTVELEIIGSDLHVFCAARTDGSTDFREHRTTIYNICTPLKNSVNDGNDAFARNRILELERSIQELKTRIAQQEEQSKQLINDKNRIFNWLRNLGIPEGSLIVTYFRHWMSGQGRERDS